MMTHVGVQTTSSIRLLRSATRYDTRVNVTRLQRRVTTVVVVHSGSKALLCTEPDRTAHLGLQVLHGLLKRLGRSPLVVAQDGHGSVGPVVGQDLGWNVLVH